jgi:hypothetical protein
LYLDPFSRTIEPWKSPWGKKKQLLKPLLPLHIEGIEEIEIVEEEKTPRERVCTDSIEPTSLSDQVMAPDLQIHRSV